MNFRYSVAAVTSVALLTLSCSRQPDRARKTEAGGGQTAQQTRPTSADRRDAFFAFGPVSSNNAKPQVVDSVLLLASNESPIVRISGFARAGDGSIVIADASEKNVKLFDARGKLLRTLGSAGAGPGQFQDPRFPRWLRGGGLVVAEGNGRVSTFKADGAFEALCSLERIPRVSSFEVMADGHYVVAVGDGGTQSITVLDKACHRVSDVFTLQGVPVADEPAFSGWLGLNALYAATYSDTTLIASTLSDSLWIVEPSGVTRATQLKSSDLLPPQKPSEAALQDRDRFKWAKDFHRAVPPFYSGELMIIGFCRGILNYGDPNVYFVRKPGTAGFQKYTNLPPVIGVAGDTAFVYLNPNQETVWLGKLVFSAISR